MSRLIDADALLTDRRMRMYYHLPNGDIAVPVIDIEHAPTIEERKTGHWERTYLDHEAMGERPSIFYCSVCNQCIAFPVNYCPNCGADMRGDHHETP